MQIFQVQEAIRNYIIPTEVVQTTYNKEKEIINLNPIFDNNRVILDDQDCRNILMKGSESQRRNIKVIVANNNSI